LTDFTRITKLLFGTSGATMQFAWPGGGISSAQSPDRVSGMREQTIGSTSHATACTAGGLRSGPYRCRECAMRTTSRAA